MKDGSWENWAESCHNFNGSDNHWRKPPVFLSYRRFSLISCFLYEDAAQYWLSLVFLPTYCTLKPITLSSGWTHNTQRIISENQFCSAITQTRMQDFTQTHHVWHTQTNILRSFRQQWPQCFPSLLRVAHEIWLSSVHLTSILDKANPNLYAACQEETLSTTNARDTSEFIGLCSYFYMPISP